MSGSITVIHKIFIKAKITVVISIYVEKNRHFQICYFEFTFDAKVLVHVSALH